MAAPGALFEAPLSHESHYSNPYSNPEDFSNPEFEWEAHEAHEAHYSNPYSNPEGEWELPEAHEAHYSNPYSNPEDFSNPEEEWETHEAHEAHYSNPYSNPEGEWEAHYSNPYSNPEDFSNPEEEWETHEAHEAHYSNPYSIPEGEWEAHEAHFSSPEFEWEDEGEFFFKGLKRFASRVGKFVAPLAKRLAPFAVKALVGMIPGVGAIAAPLAGRLTSQLLREAAAEAAAMEAEFFGTNEAEAEVGNTEAAHEAALTELLAAEAAGAESTAEAEATLAAALPITITIMGGRRPLRRVMPTLAQANGRLVSVLRRQARTAALASCSNNSAAGCRNHASCRPFGQPVTGPLAVRAMAAATQSVLNNPRLVQAAITRNAVLRRRVAPPSPRRAAVFTPSRTTPFNPRRAAAGF